MTPDASLAADSGSAPAQKDAATTPGSHDAGPSLPSGSPASTPAPAPGQAPAPAMMMTTAPQPRTAAGPARQQGPLAPDVSPPEVLGAVAGPGAKAQPSDLTMYGTDMGLTFEHDGQLLWLFGDTWNSATAICDGPVPSNDDTLATAALDFAGSVPALRFLTQPDLPGQLANLQLLRGTESLKLGYGQAPVAGFSDGRQAYGLFQRLDPVRCDAPWAQGAEACPEHDHFSCKETLGTCEPAWLSFPVICDPTSANSCLPGQTCTAAPLCVDQTSSQYDDGHFQGLASSTAFSLEIGAADSSNLARFQSLFSFPSNKFTLPATRTVKKFTGHSDGNDFRPGHDTLLIWGRSGIVAEHGRDAHLYLMTHPLPLPLDAIGKLRFTPQYFAGIDAKTGEPTWSPLQSEAKAIALDGQVDGDPHESAQVLGPMTVSWLGAPINKWVLLYGGDLADYLMLDADSSRSMQAPGSIIMRFADHPWGPFSPARPHAVPGSPLRHGDGYGPGGYMYHPDCVDSDKTPCARSDPKRPLDTAIQGCPTKIVDPGRLYAPNVIDSYTLPSPDGGLDMIWNVSTWNPYAVQLLKTHVYPPGRLSQPKDELADADALQRLQDWKRLPSLNDAHRYVQQTSRDRGTFDTSFPLSNYGNRDFNNFVCKSRDADLGAGQSTPLRFDLDACPESYVHGVVTARFEGAGYMARMWLGMLSLLDGPADREVLRIYVDDDERPRVEVKLAEVLDGRAGEIFAPPFGTGSTKRMAWYYPVAFRKKLIVAIDHLDDDVYYFHCDVVPRAPSTEPLPTERLPERDAAARQLSARFHPTSPKPLLRDRDTLALAPGAMQALQLSGPATIEQLRVRVPAADQAKLGNVQVQISWDDATAPAVDVPLLALFGGSIAPERSSLALTSFSEADAQILALNLPLPFARSARLQFHNRGSARVAFEVELHGSQRVPQGEFGHLHVIASETLGPTTASAHKALQLKGRGRLVGLCGQMQGHADPTASFQSAPLNYLEGDVRATVDGALALDGTGTEEYADDVFYYHDAPHANAFVEAWGLNDNQDTNPGRASFCRWHVLGTELDFSQAIDLEFELGGAANPGIVERFQTWAFVYLAD